MKKIFFLSLSAGFLFSCNNSTDKKDESTAIKGIDRSYLDTTISPADDFYMYANNGWIKNASIPASEAYWGTIMELRDNVLAKVKSTLDSASAKTNAPKGSNEQLAGDFYASGLDSAKVEQSGIAPLKESLERINDLKDKSQTADLAAYLHSHLISVLFSCSVDPDSRKSDVVVTGLWQGGLSLPDRDYYFRKDEHSVEIRQKYVAHVKNVFVLMGEDEATAQKDAESVMALETALAKVSWTNVENRDPVKTYNKKSVNELAKLCPAFNWVDFFNKTGIHEIDSIVIGQPSFFAGLNSVLVSTSLDNLKKYCAYGLVDELSPRLSSAFVNESFDFYDHTLSGVKAIKPRWKRILSATDRALEDAVGKLFVDKYFPAEAKQHVNEMVDDLIAAYKDRIKTRDWMSDST